MNTWQNIGQKMGEENYLKTCTENALPPEFEKLDYFTFIEKRRKLMAKIIKKATRNYEILLFVVNVKP